LSFSVDFADKIDPQARQVAELIEKHGVKGKLEVAMGA